MKITHIVVWNALTKNQKPYIGVEILLKFAAQSPGMVTAARYM
jgi:hypothetical protein